MDKDFLGNEFRETLDETLGFVQECFTLQTVVPAGVISLLGFTLFCGVWIVF